MTLNQSLPLSEPQFPHLENEDKNSPPFNPVFVRFRESPFNTSSGHSKCSVIGSLVVQNICLCLSLPPPLFLPFFFPSSSSWAAFSVSSQGKVRVPIQLRRNCPARRLGPSLPAWVLSVSSQAFDHFGSAPGARGPGLGSFSFLRQGLPGRCWLGSLEETGGPGAFAVSSQEQTPF